LTRQYCAREDASWHGDLLVAQAALYTGARGMHGAAARKSHLDGKSLISH
jgi:hypothetical protein